MQAQRNRPLRSRTGADLRRVSRTVPAWKRLGDQSSQPQRHGQLSSMPVYNRSGLSSDAESCGEVLWMEERRFGRRVRIWGLWTCLLSYEIEDEADQESGGLEAVVRCFYSTFFFSVLTYIEYINRFVALH